MTTSNTTRQETTSNATRQENNKFRNSWVCL